MSEQEFVQGMFVDKKTFDWGEIIAVSFKVEEMVAWLQANANDKGYANVDIKESKAGKLYAAKNTFVPKAQDVPATNAVDVVEPMVDSEIPF